MKTNNEFVSEDARRMPLIQSTEPANELSLARLFGFKEATDTECWTGTDEIGWWYLSKNGRQLAHVKNIVVKICRTQSTNADPVAFAALSFDVLNKWQQAANTSLYLELMNEEAGQTTLLDVIKMGDMARSCGLYKRASYVQNFDPQFFDLVNLVNFGPDARGAWHQC